MTKQERNGLELIYEAGDPSRRVVALAAAWGHQEARRLLGVSEPAEEWTDPAAVVLQTSGLWDSLPLRRPLVWLCAGLCAVSLQAGTLRKATPRNKHKRYERTDLLNAPIR